MVETLRVIPGLDEDATRLFNRLIRKIDRQRKEDDRLEAYYQGSQILDHMGVSLPDYVRIFETVVNVPRMAVDEVERRLDVKSLLIPGQGTPDMSLRDIWDQNSMEAQLPLVFKDALIFGRGFMSVAKNRDGRAHIQAESPKEIAAWWDAGTRELVGAVRRWADPLTDAEWATLYLPGVTRVLSPEGGWHVVAEYAAGPKVPIVAFVNRPMTKADYTAGTSEMADILGMTDSIARLLTGLQLGAEFAAAPQRYVSGVSQEDFEDPETGQALPTWAAYFGSLWATKNPDAKFGTLEPANLRNFYETVNNMLGWCAAVLGLPIRYFGNQTVNPAAEGAIRADEARLVKNCERKQIIFGEAISQVMTLAAETELPGLLPASGRVKVEWQDPATPTFAQKADALQKLAGGKSLLSVFGAWDELGWTEARKERERQYLLEESEDDALYSLLKQDSNPVADEV